jgi:hypothetical protein
MEKNKNQKDFLSHFKMLLKKLYLSFELIFNLNQIML